jgi:hypothetical protein
MRVPEQSATRNQETARSDPAPESPDKDIQFGSVHSDQIDSEDDEEMHGKAERWHTFKTP